jgi:hypothetical protein
MKMKLISSIIVLGVALFLPVFSQAQDAGQPDTAIIMTSRPEAGGNDSMFVVEIWAWHDATDILPTIGFKWDSEKLTLDSAKVNPAFSSIFLFVFFYDSDIATSNANNRALISGANLSNSGITPQGARYLVSTYYFTISPKWDVADEFMVDSAAWDDGSELLFTEPSSGAQWTPVWAYGDIPVRVQDPSDAGSSTNLPATYSLRQNYPNPFNPETVIEFSLEKAGNYTFTVYNVIGQVVDRIEGLGEVGQNEVHWNGSNQSSGVYFYKLQAGDFTETKKMMLVK